MQATEAVTEVPLWPQHIREVSTFKAPNPFPATVSVPIKSAFQGPAQPFGVIREVPRAGGTPSRSTDRAG